MPLQQRVHWGSFCRPDMGLGMGLPSLGMGDLTGDFKFLSLSVGDTPRDKNRVKKNPHTNTVSFLQDWADLKPRNCFLDLLLNLYLIQD